MTVLRTRPNESFSTGVNGIVITNNGVDVGDSDLAAVLASASYNHVALFTGGTVGSGGSGSPVWHPGIVSAAIDGSGNLIVTYSDGVVQNAGAVGGGVGKAPLLTPTASKTGAYTAAASDLVMADATNGNVPIALATLAAGSMVAVKKTDASTNTVTVTLPDSSTVVLRLQGETRTFLSTGSTYTVVSGLNTLSSLDARYFFKPDETGAAVGMIPAVSGVDGQGKPTGYALTVPLNPFAAAIVFGG